MSIVATGLIEGSAFTGSSPKPPREDGAAFDRLVSSYTSGAQKDEPRIRGAGALSRPEDSSGDNNIAEKMDDAGKQTDLFLLAGMMPPQNEAVSVATAQGVQMTSSPNDQAGTTSSVMTAAQSGGLAAHAGKETAVGSGNQPAQSPVTGQQNQTSAVASPVNMSGVGTLTAINALMSTSQMMATTEATAMPASVAAAVSGKVSTDQTTSGAMKSGSVRSTNQSSGTTTSAGTSGSQTSAMTGSQGSSGVNPAASPGQNASTDMSSSQSDGLQTILTETNPEAPDFDLIEEGDLSGDLLQQTQQARPDVKTDAGAQLPRTTSQAQMAALLSQVSDKLLQRFDGKTSSFEIRLDPAELGKVDVRVEVDADGRVQAVLAARDPAAAEALMRGAKTLENALLQAGLNLGEGGVQIELDQRGQKNFNPETGKDAQSSNGQDEGSAGDAPAEQDQITWSDTSFIQNWSRQRLDVRA